MIRRSPDRRRRGRDPVGFALQTSALFGLWLLLSDQRRPLFIGLGVAAAVLVTLATRVVVVSVLGEPGPRARLPRRAGWALVWAGWLCWSIAAASVQIAYLVLNRRRPFRPRFVAFRTDLERPASRTLLVLSITLVPGSMAVRQQGTHLLVHALVPESARDVETGRLQNLIARMMGEGPQPAPEMHWGPVIEEAVR